MNEGERIKNKGKKINSKTPLTCSWQLRTTEPLQSECCCETEGTGKRQTNSKHHSFFLCCKTLHQRSL